MALSYEAMHSLTQLELLFEASAITEGSGKFHAVRKPRHI